MKWVNVSVPIPTDEPEWYFFFTAAIMFCVWLWISG